MDLHIRQEQIDNVFISKKWNNSALNCKAYSSFQVVSSNHRIVTAKIRLTLRKNATWTTTTVHYDWSLLNNRDISTKKQIWCTCRTGVSECYLYGTFSTSLML